MPIFSRFGADFFTVYADFSRFIRDINGEKKKNVIDDRFFTVSFSRFAPSRIITQLIKERFCGVILKLPHKICWSNFFTPKTVDPHNVIQNYPA